MPRYSTTKKRFERIDIGSMNSRITVYNRNIAPPSGPNDIEFLEKLTNGKGLWAMFDSVNGVTVFDRTGTEKIITHIVYLRYTPNFIITSETWLSYQNDYYRILKVENFGNENRFIKMFCVRLGTTDYDVNYA
jgi:hypothetical protein